MKTHLGFLDWVLRFGDSSSFECYNINPEHFFGEDEAKAYQAINKHLEIYGRLPSREVVKMDSGVDIPRFPDQTGDYWVDLILRIHTERLLKEGLVRIQARMEAQKHEDALSELVSLADALQSGFFTHETVTNETIEKAFLTAYDKKEHIAGIPGIPFGLPGLDKVSRGSMAGDFNVIVGRPGRGKTQLMLKCAHGAHLFGKKFLLFTYEMSEEALTDRFMGFVSGLPATKIRSARLGYYGLERLKTYLDGSAFKGLTGDKLHEEMIRRQRGLRKDIPFQIKRGIWETTVEDLIAQVRRIRPDVLYVDGASSLQTRAFTTSAPDRISHTAHKLKSLAQELRIPVIANYQFNRNQAKEKETSIDNIYMSDAIGQLASIAISIENDPVPSDREGGKSYKIAHIMKGREGEDLTLKLVYDMERTSIYELDDPDLVGGIEDDSDGREDPFGDARSF